MASLSTISDASTLSIIFEHLWFLFSVGLDLYNLFVPNFWSTTEKLEQASNQNQLSPHSKWNTV